MLNLDHDLQKIEDFIQDSIQKFQTESGQPSSIGIYCCPWAGWLTTNFNLSKTLEETQNNCPDFQVVAYHFLDLPEWQEEYEKSEPIFQINGSKIELSPRSGDEKPNGTVFDYLKPIVARIKSKNAAVFLLQILDSRFVEVVGV